VDAVPVLPAVTVLLKRSERQEQKKTYRHPSVIFSDLLVPARGAFVESEGLLHPPHPSDHDQHVHARSIAQYRFRCFWPSRQCLSFPATCAPGPMQSNYQDRKFQVVSNMILRVMKIVSKECKLYVEHHFCRSSRWSEPRASNEQVHMIGQYCTK